MGIDGAARSCPSFKFLKGKCYANSEYKAQTLTLQAPWYAFNDSARLLLIHAIQNDVFMHIKSWSDLLTCAPAITGSIIHLKEEALDRLVFELGDDDTNIPRLLTKTRMQNLMTPISRLARFHGKALLHAVRHGAAYVLSKSLNPGRARDQMRHMAHTHTFEKYMSKVSAINMQSLAKGMAEQNLSKMASVGLCRTTTPVIKASIDANTKLQANGEYRELCATTFECQSRWVKLRFGGDRPVLCASEVKARYHAAWMDLETTRTKRNKFMRRFMEMELHKEYEMNHLASVAVIPTDQHAPESSAPSKNTTTSSHDDSVRLHRIHHVDLDKEVTRILNFEFLKNIYLSS
ncbi:unnamed protein product [Calypogeia fissa]